AINVGKDNFALAQSSFPPQFDPAHPTALSVGGNHVSNIGNNNEGEALDGLGNGVVNIGDRNWGVAAGVLSNVVQIGNDNHGVQKVFVPDPKPDYESTDSNSDWKPKGHFEYVPVPNTAIGIGAENLVV